MQVGCLLSSHGSADDAKDTTQGTVVSIRLHTLDILIYFWPFLLHFFPTHSQKCCEAIFFVWKKV